MIVDADVERVRESADIVGIIGEYVELRRMGADFRGPCPFHQGAHRNFSVSPRKRLYYCFVCHEHGDVFSFLQKRLGIEWPAAVRMVAEKSGIEIREVKAGRTEGPDPREPLWEANAAAAEYFRRMLWEDDAGRGAREYLAQRQISRELADAFGLGFAPRDRGGMRGALAALGIDDERQLLAGLLVGSSEEEEPRPRFFQRLMFPILDLNGRCVGFGGRVIGSGEPKYLNSAESATYAKGEMLYNLHAARLAARREERMFVVEGYFDAMRVFGAGVECVVAPLGTAVTESQAVLIKRYARDVFLMYDGDKAGLKATFRAGDLLLRQGASVRVVSFPGGEDPDSFVLAHGRDGLERAVAASIDVFERKIQILERSGYFADLHKRRVAIDHLVPTIRACADPVTRDIYLARAAEVSGVARPVLEREAALPARGSGRPGALRGPPAGPPPPEPPERSGRGESRPIAARASRAGPSDSAERELVRAMLKEPTVVERVTERFGPDSFQHPIYREIFGALLESGGGASVEELAEALSEQANQEVETLRRDADAIQHLERTVEDSLARLEQRQLEDRNREIDALIPMANGAEKDLLVEEKVANQRVIARLREARENQ